LAPKKISTRANPQESPVTPVPNPELILKRGRSFQGRISKSSTQSNPLSHSKKSIAENTESSSSNIVSEKASVTTVEESIISYQEEDV
jgi:hypothetical protein